MGTPNGVDYYYAIHICDNGVCNFDKSAGYWGTHCDPIDKKKDTPPNIGSCNHGLCGYQVSEMMVSLNLTDTPVGYAPPKGLPVYTRLTYNQPAEPKHELCLQCLGSAHVCGQCQQCHHTDLNL